jgi:site-specific DNA-methyltransferase (adenine-specific)
VLFKDESGSSSDAQITAFDDSWHWGEAAQQTYENLITNAPANVASMINSLHQFIGNNQMMAYLVMMTARLVELHRVLKPTGSLYLHCDPTASHYLKMLLDMVFGVENFHNEIIWRRTSAHNAIKSFGVIHDVILFYSKSEGYFFKKLSRPYMKGHVEKRYTIDDTGRLKFSSGGNVLSGPGITKGDSCLPWRGFDPIKKNRHWAIPKYLTEKFKDELSEKTIPERLEFLYQNNLIEIVDGNAWPTPVRYLEEDTPTQSTQDIWAYQPYTEGTVFGTKEGIDQDVAWMGTTSPERLGYQTQKPIGLLERIINSSSPENGLVLDPFSGCGTCISAAQKLGRQWIGIDITHLAIAMHKSRLKTAFGLEPKRDYQVIGEPEDLAGAQQLATEDRYQFQWWALSLIEAQPLGGNSSDKTGKKGSDKGIDGVINFLDDRKGGGMKRALVQVKSGHVNSAHIRDLKGTLEREGAQIGVFITLEPATRDMNTEAVTAGSYHSEIWNKDFPRLQILSIEELLNGVEVKIPPSSSGAFKKAGKIDEEEPKQQTLGI